MKKQIGFIGLGVMGKPMAKNLMKAGYSLWVYDIVKEPVQELVGSGAKAARSAKEVGEKSDVVISIVPTSKEVQEVYLNEDGVLAGIKSGSIIVDMSTIDPIVSQEVAAAALEKKVEMLDAPVSGGQVGATEGTLTIMVEVFSSCACLFRLHMPKHLSKSHFAPSGQPRCCHRVKN